MVDVGKFHSKMGRQPERGGLSSRMSFQDEFPGCRSAHLDDRYIGLDDDQRGKNNFFSGRGGGETSVLHGSAIK